MGVASDGGGGGNITCDEGEGALRTYAMPATIFQDVLQRTYRLPVVEASRPRTLESWRLHFQSVNQSVNESIFVSQIKSYVITRACLISLFSVY